MCRLSQSSGANNGAFRHDNRENINVWSARVHDGPEKSPAQGEVSEALCPVEAAQAAGETVAWAYHDSHDRKFRDPFGARPCGSTVTLRIIVGSRDQVKECILCVMDERTGEEMAYPMQVAEKRAIALPGAPGASQRPLTGIVFERDIALPNRPGLIWYYFRLDVNGNIYFYHNNPERLGGVGMLCPISDGRIAPEPKRTSGPHCPPYQITVYKPSAVPEWFKRGVMYQIFVDRFYNPLPEGKVLNPKRKCLIHAHWHDTPFYIRDEKGRVKRWDFFGGNLLGVIEKLPYLEELGISIIYLNPIFEASSNHKYDVGDYHKIDPMYGDLEVFRRLAREARRRGISIVLDGVFSHTGADSKYFNKYGSYPGLGAYQAEISPYYKWYRLERPGGRYECWWGEEDLPNVNELEPSYLEFITGEKDGVARYWLRQGARGWRLDVADELPDEFIRILRKAVKETDPEAVLIGEVWEDASNKISYGVRREYFSGHELDSVMNYPLRDILLRYILGHESAKLSVQRMMSLYENYPPENFRATMNLLGSHDRIRILTILGDAPPEGSLSVSEREEYRLSGPQRERAVKRLKLLVLLQMTLPGVPCVYYGDEAGVEGYSDPFNRAPYPWGREDRELLEWHKKMIWLRNEYDVFKDGDFSPFHIGDDVLGFRARSQGEEMVVCVNRDRYEAKEFTIPLLGNHLEGDEDPEEPGEGAESCNRPGEGRETEIRADGGRGLTVLELLSGQEVSRDGPGTSIRCRLEPLEGKVFYAFRRPPRELAPAPKAETPADLGSRRSCGVLLHITSLPSRWGVGDMGKEARRFVDFLAASGHAIWQVLPLNPPGSGNSPYSGPSVMAGNPLLISPDLLLEEDLLAEDDLWPELALLRESDLREDRVSYPLVTGIKERLFRKAWERFRAGPGSRRPTGTGEAPERPGNGRGETFEDFVTANSWWLDDFCLFMALKNKLGGLSWTEWDEPLAMRFPDALEKAKEDLSDEIEYRRFLQYVFHRQWKALKDYANRRGIAILGDVPMYPDADSADTWANQRLFKLDEAGRPESISGVPPDYFSPTGQLWGNPVYRWREMEKDGYAWWKGRIRRMLELCDYLRLDHFRGFAGFWEVPAGEKTAQNGRWMKGPGKRFFEALREEFGDLPFIAEDLGFITPDVLSLRSITGLPGMRVFQFEGSPEKVRADAHSLETSYSRREEHGKSKQRRDENVVYYSGTHDNDTLAGWCSGGRGLVRRILRRIYLSDARWVIVPFQDLLGLGSEARMNTPGTPEGNWEWRMKAEHLEAALEGPARVCPECPDEEPLSQWVRRLAEESGRTAPGTSS